MKKLLILLSALLPLTSVVARTETIKSPDGQIVVTVCDDNGKPTYSVALNGVEFMQNSPLGVVTDFADLSQGLTLTDVKTRSISQDYTVPTIKQPKVHYEANSAIITFQRENKDALQVEWNISNRDVAFRYNIIQPKNDFYASIVKEEATGFVVPEGSTTFLCPQMLPMTGFAGTAPSYETHYTADDATGKNGWNEGYTFPCLFRNGDKGWLLISETGVTSAYCGSRLLNVEGNSYKIGFPQEKENNGNGQVSPGVSLPFSTPWRTITLGKTLAPIVETTVAWDLVEEQYPASKEFVYGRGSWSWIMKMDPSCNYDEQKNYIDFSAAMGYQTVLIDAMWDTQIGYEKMEELVKYAASKNVGIYLWYNSNGYWNHAPQGPRGIMGRAINRKAEMKWLKDIGVRGLKIDFFGGDKQVTMQLYEDILSDANDYGLNIIFHGCTLPRGWEKMYPNFVAAEAVRASENLFFGQAECDKEAFNATMYPFVRNTVGNMDFGGSALNKHWGFDGTRGNTRRTSDVFALATAVIFQSPVQHFALAPNNLNDAPEWAINFMKNVPTLWDEVKFIDGYPGKYIVMARRSGNKWYIVGINADEKPLALTLNLADFDLGNTYSIYCDDAKLNSSLKQAKMTKKKTIKVSIPQNGGLVIM